MARKRPPSVADAVPAHGDHPEDVLSTSPFEKDVRSALAAAPKERSRPSVTLVLICGLLLAAGFASGIEANKHWGTSGEPSGAPAAGNGRGMPGGGGSGGGGPGAGGRQAAPGRGATVGTVKVVSQGTLYVQTTDGSVVTVEIGDATKVQVSRVGKVSDLQPGAAVTVQGTGDASGKVTATTITQGASGARPGN
ncbi:hypothetical protein [Spirillospora sp. NPDC029432]|uniref:hypothetical protein n=1 Tax=Spirillospora sp. NPDC029432 TaxID=3154599 RepID=UPI003456E20E